MCQTWENLNICSCWFERVMLRILSLNSFIKSWLNIQSFLDDVPVPSLLMSRELSILKLNSTGFTLCRLVRYLLITRTLKCHSHFVILSSVIYSPGGPDQKFLLEIFIKSFMHTVWLMIISPRNFHKVLRLVSCLPLNPGFIILIIRILTTNFGISV